MHNDRQSRLVYIPTGWPKRLRRYPCLVLTEEDQAKNET